MMRTTLTIEDGLANELKRRAIEAGKPFKQVVNEALLAGLQGPITPRLKPYRLKPVSLGAPSAAIDLVKALQLADGLEDDAIRAKLEQRK